MRPWYKSRTIYVATAAGALSLLQLATDVVSDPDVVALCFGVIGAVQLYLRTLTERPLT